MGRLCDYDIDRYARKLKGMVTDGRYRHSVGVMETARALAAAHGADGDRASVAGLLHDLARDLSQGESDALWARYGLGAVMPQPYGFPDYGAGVDASIAHSYIGAAMAGDPEVLGITDEGVLDAIRHHTVGKANMSLLAKVVFVADYAEPGRRYAEAGMVREVASTDIDAAALMKLDRSIAETVRKGRMAAVAAMAARNWLIRGLGGPGAR